MKIVLVALLGLTASTITSAVNPCLDLTDIANECQVDSGTVTIIGCDITDEDVEAGDLASCLDDVGRETIQTLSISDNARLTDLPEGVFAELTALEHLELCDNALTTLPEGVFSGLTALEIVELDGNALTALPEGIFQGLTALEKVFLGRNALTTLPEGIFKDLTALKSLNLDENFFTALPQGVFADVTGLELLRLDENGLTSLPDIVDLTSLEILRLDFNALTTLPDGIFQDLTNLEILHLEGNSLECLPTTHLEEVDDDATIFTGGLRVDTYGTECGCFISDVTVDVCGGEVCTPGSVGYTCEALTPTPVPAPAPTPGPTLGATPAPISVPVSPPELTITPTPAPDSGPEGSSAPVEDWTANSCAIGSICPGNQCCHPVSATCGRKHTFCQERDLFNDVRCCSGTDGDPSELNSCAEDSICDTPGGESTLERTEVWLSIVASILAIGGVAVACLCRERNNDNGNIDD